MQLELKDQPELSFVERGNGDFEAQTPLKSGFFTPFDAKKIQLLSDQKGKRILVANNNEALQFFEYQALP